MKYKTFLICLIISFLAEIFALVMYINHSADFFQDPVEVNEAVQSVRLDWDKIERHKNVTFLDYTVINENGTPLYETRSGLSKSINEAVIHRDTILDIDIDGKTAGKIIIYNGNSQDLKNSRKNAAAFMIFAAAIQFCICAVYSVYLKLSIINPFRRLKNFAEHIAGGNLDFPLKMDRNNIFGAFTESFDIMRSELKKARLAEARANSEKKELVAKLSHDIRTPVASIRAASEIGAAIAETEKNKQNYVSIIQKADQINALVTNLFSATLEELKQFSIEPADMKSSEISEMLEYSDYFHYAEIPAAPDCMIYADKLRLQQVFDNIFANSYKYANTKIIVDISLNNNYIQVKIKDFGSGVTEKELPLLKKKFMRGKNAESLEGAGLGLYISDCIMTEMKGSLNIANDTDGLAVTINIPLSGTI